MARTKIKIDEAVLRSVIAECEQERAYTNRSMLFEDVASKYNTLTDTTILNAQLVYLRVNELQIELKTPKGKKGRAKGSKIEGGGKRVSRAEKFAGNLSVQGSFSDLRSSVPAQYRPLVKKIEQGSIKAAIKLNCLSCVGFERKVDGVDQIGNCECTNCPMFCFRPYQKKR